MKRIKMFVLTGIMVLMSFNGLIGQTTYRSLKQPDGTTFQAIERGDEWLHFLKHRKGISCGGAMTAIFPISISIPVATSCLRI